MRPQIIFVSILFFKPSLAFCADYNVPDSGSLNEAIAAANANTSVNPYEINISGSHDGSGEIKKSVLITGTGKAELSGSLKFTGKDFSSEINRLTFTKGKETAISNGSMPEKNAQKLILNAVSFDKRSDSAIFNTGNLTIGYDSFFTNNVSDNGGAIFNTGTLQISGASFSENTAKTSGGAINSSGTLEILDSVFDKNKTNGYNGGALYVFSNTQIGGTTFTGNTASEGGAIYVGRSNAELTIDNSSFIGNSTSLNSQGVADFGGAIHSMGKIRITNTLFDGNFSTQAGAIKLRRGTAGSFIGSSEFKNNYAFFNYGGAIVNDSGLLTISNTKFTNNYSKVSDGGAIYSISDLVVADNSLFTLNNAAKNGGALYALSSLTVDGAIFSENKAAVYGGGIYSSGVAILKNVDINKNTAVYGGGIMNFGNMTVKGNSSFVDNSASAGGAIFTVGDLTLDTTEGDILFKGNKALNSDDGGADIYLNGSGTVNVTIQGNSNTLSMDGGFSGSGQINKTGQNTLIFGENADNSLFQGKFTQSAGTTEVYADNFFGGTNIVTDKSVLHFARNASVNELRLQNGGRLDLRRPNVFSPNILSVTDLTSDGSAVIALQTDGTESDLLRITGSASGMFTLDVNAVGSSPTLNKIEIVNMENAAGNAAFKLSGNKLDIGAYEYDLTQDQNSNWYLETKGDLTQTAKSVKGLPSLHLSIVNAGLNELRKRLGDLRSDNPTSPAGAWVRGYGKYLRIHEKMSAKMGLLGMEGGFDVMTHMMGGRTYFGVLGGYLTSENIRVFQPDSDAKGHTHTPVAGLYTTWIQDSSKWFIDLTARHFWVHTDLNNIQRSNGINGYEIQRNFWTITAETGRLFDFSAPDFIDSGHSRISVEPKIEIRYAHGTGKNFKTDTGETGSIDTTHSFVSRFNVQTSYLPQGNKSKWKLFVEAGLFNEWIGKTKIKFAGTDLTTSDLKGFGAEAAIGFNAAVSDDSYWYGAVTFESGKTYTSYMLNTGLRVKF